MDFQTKLIHGGRDRKSFFGASSVPIFQISTYNQDDPEHLAKYGYARSENPTREALEAAIAQLENGNRGFAFASGMAAISSVLMLFQPGDHLVVGNDIYGGTYRILTTVFKRWGLNSTFVDSANLDSVRAAITPTTKAIIVETPSNPMLHITDIVGVAGICHDKGLLSITDNTFMSPLLQRPLELGFDIVLHSATKFIGGHSDVIAGLAVTKDVELGRRLGQIQNAFGAILGPQDSWLVLRGLKTLETRLTAQQATAEKIAEWLVSRPEVKRVFYPTLEGHSGRDIHLKQSSGGGAVLSFELHGPSSATAFLRAVKLPLVAVSLGGVESILSYPVTMSHAAMPPAQREASGITGSLVRLSVGLESSADLIDDFTQAFAGLKKG
jgi:cysteine-S-conjugate beta-lyase